MPELSRSRVQGTIRSYDRESRSGSLLLDDGVELSYDLAAFDAAGVRHLRIGQRVAVELEGSGAETRVRAIAFYTLH